MNDTASQSIKPAMTLWQMVLAGVRHHWRVSLAVALGVATATAVISGALFVGDSMRGSLRSLTVQRLGKTRSAVIPGGFFELNGITNDPNDVAGLILFSRGVVETPRQFNTDHPVRRAGSVQIIGCDEQFWKLDDSGVIPKELPSGDNVVINASTAAELDVKVGDQVTVRLPKEEAVPADSPLGSREVQSEGLPSLTVVDIIPDRGLGRFSFSPSQASPQIIYLDRSTIAEALDRDGQANVLLSAKAIQTDDLKVDLKDLGLQLKRMTSRFPAKNDDAVDQNQVIFDYYSVTSDRLLISDKATELLEAELPADSVQRVTTYLANAIEKLDSDGNVVASVPYSTISAIDSSDALPLKYETQTSDSDRVPFVINSWTADRLDAEIGTPLRVAYFEPEVENGNEIERYFDVVVTDVVPITKPAKPYYRSRPAVYSKSPTKYNDPNLTPDVPGVTDQDSMSDWDLPFKLEREIPSEDDLYWKEHRLTPKAFLPLADGERLFGSRFGKTTGLRIDPAVAVDTQALEQRLYDSLRGRVSDLGWQVLPIRDQQLAASSGTTPFDALFLSLSFFVIFAAIMLIAMLFRLGLTSRLKQFGTLLAVGWSPKKVSRLGLGEGFAIAAIGVVLGLIGGVLYAKLVLHALRNWWVGAVTVPFLEFHWTLRSLFIGGAIGWLVAAVTLWWTLRSILKINARSLLAGRDDDQIESSGATSNHSSPKKSKLPMIAAALALIALIVAGLGASMGGQAAAGGFVGGGMLLLVAILIWVHDRLRRPRKLRAKPSVKSLATSSDESPSQSTGKSNKYTIGALSARNASRHPLRSTLTIGLMAVAAFLIIAITAFRLQPTDRGTGGYQLIAQTAQPVFKDLQDSDFVSDTFGPDAKKLDGAQIASLRLRPGQDASCNNLYRASHPTVLGIPSSFRPPAGFDWAAMQEVDEGKSAWTLLEQPATGTKNDPIPMVLDQNTAMWSLQMYTGVGPKSIKAFEYESGKPIYFRVVGLLSNSVLQGKVMIGEANFHTIFPNISGYQFFFVSCEPDQQEKVSFTLEDRLSDVGMDVSDAKQVLSGMLAVQNTYLRTFQSLGALGLLLGTIGLAIAQLRSVLERRQELAVMRAIGFTRKRLAVIVMSETAALLLTGIGCGVLCAVLAVLPYAFLSGLKPPIVEPLIVLAAIILFGLIAGMLAVRQVLKMPLMDALRPE